MSEWKEVELSELINFGNGKKKPDSVGDVPIYGGNGILGYSANSNYENETIIIGRVGAYCGSVYYVNKPIWVSDNALAAKVKSNNSTKFLYYFLKNANLNQHAGGSSHPLVTQTLLNSLEYNICIDESEQNAIASVLSSLDDKIDLLHRQNQTLEQMAETLFRQWFVEEADSDWEFTSLEKFVTCFNGVSYKSADLNPSNKAMITLKSFGRDGGFRLDGFKEYTGKHKEQHMVYEGDLVVAHTDITQDAALIGNPIMVTGRREYKTLLISMDLVKVVSNHDWLSTEFLYYLMKSRDFKQHCLGYSNGSTVLHLSKQAVPSYEFFLPPKELIAEFTRYVKSFIEKYNKNIKHIRNLEEIRDTLLPKLMSGEVRVVDKPVTGHKKSKEARSEFKEAVLIANIVRTFFTPKIGNVSRKWYQKIAYLHKRKLKELADQQSVIELTTEYSKKAAGPYKKKMRYQGAEGICIKNKYLEAVNDHAFRPSYNIDKIDKYFDKYWDRELFENWTTKKFRFVPVRQLGVYATVDYSLLELKKQGKELSVSNVIDNFSGSKEWEPKKDQPEFLPQNIDQAIIDLKTLYSY